MKSNIRKLKDDNTVVVDEVASIAFQMQAIEQVQIDSWIILTSFRKTQD
jgi:hypothetical protein